MNKKQLVTKISSSMNLSKADAERTLDGITEIIHNDEEMRSTKVDCRKWDDERKNWGCFRLVYPITFIMQDGSFISMLDDKDWIELKSWYEVNPDIKEFSTNPLLSGPSSYFV